MNGKGRVSIFRTKDGKVKAWGINDYYQLGIQTDKEIIAEAIEIPIDGNELKTFDCGTNHTVFLMKDGTVYGCGSNKQNQLGLDEMNEKNILTKLPINGVKDVKCGSYHTVFLMEDGSVMSCGDNSNGQLGLGQDNDNLYKKITKVEALGYDVSKIVCGNRNSIFQLKSGTIKGCGSNYQSELGEPNTERDIYDIRVLNNIAGTEVREIVTSTNNTYFLMKNGDVKGCGDNSMGGLALPSESVPFNSTIIRVPISEVNHIRATGSCIICMMNDGKVKGTGYNLYGELTHNPTSDYCPPRRFVPLEIENVVDIYTGSAFELFLMKDGTVYGCGYNMEGALSGAVLVKKLITPYKLPIENVLPWH